ncbi:hypothetical protein B5S30_g4395 [[Candida] boidinii]|nr:hypothetical protein B5S30_g4395 [[Candida] boidinii]
MDVRVVGDVVGKGTSYDVRVSIKETVNLNQSSTKGTVVLSVLTSAKVTSVTISKPDNSGTVAEAVGDEIDDEAAEEDKAAEDEAAADDEDSVATEELSSPVYAGLSRVPETELSKVKFLEELVAVCWKLKVCWVPSARVTVTVKTPENWVAQL